MEMHTYAEWAAAGRTVIKGEKAKFYRVNPERSQGIALFVEGQTISLERAAQANKDWSILTAEEWTTARKEHSAAKPTVIVDAWEHEGKKVVAVWCGSNKKAIKALQKAGYTFNIGSHRWLKRDGRTPEDVIAGWQLFDYAVKLGPQLASQGVG